MKNTTKRLFAFLLMFALAFTLFACNSKPKDEDPQDPIVEDPHELTGEYAIDITNLGMPLVFYLRINEDGTFILSPNRLFTDNRGSGLLQEASGTYMMIYSDHTVDVPKTATFLVENGNLVFQTTLPYGASNIRQSQEDPDDPAIVYILTALSFAFEEFYGVYAGTHTVMAMGSQVVYSYTITLSAGLQYVFHSEFTMGGTPYSYTETGVWEIDGEVFSITPLTPEVVATVVGTLIDGSIVIGVKASTMGARAERTLTLATHAEWAGTYYGYRYFAMGGTVMTNATATLVLGYFGEYSIEVYNAINEQTLTETGTYVVSGTGLVLTVNDTEEEVLGGTLQNYVLVANFVVPGSMGGRSQFTFYNEIINGTFTATETLGDEGFEVEYEVTLVLNQNGTYTLIIIDEDMVELVNATGTFTVQTTMLTMLVLTDLIPAPTIVISKAGLNMNIEFGDFIEAVGFFLVK